MAEQQPAAGSPGEFCIFIKTLSGKTFSVLVSLDDSVRELKAKLNAQDDSLTLDGSRLIYNSREMIDEMTLQHYEITPNCLLHHVTRLRGGGEAVKHELSGKVMPWSSLTTWCSWWSCMVVSVGPQLTAWW
ncbi:UBIQP protein, partial [Hydrobates tethys]|nr:UBIQP protein [Oceanodroma tethys]